MKWIARVKSPYEVRVHAAGKGFLHILLVVSILLLSRHAQASSTRPIKIDIELADPLTNLGYSIRPDPTGFPYSLAATIELPSPLLLKGDVYFGIMRPDGSNVFSWTASDTGPKLVKGFVPIGANIDLGKITMITTRELAGEIKYVPSGGEVPGMYFIFALLATAGGDPANVESWVKIELRPLAIRAGDAGARPALVISAWTMGRRR